MTTRPLTEKKTEQLHQKVGQVVTDNKKASLELAMVLHETYVSTTIVNDSVMFVYEAWGYKSWPQFVRTEMGIFKTTADKYRKVWRIFGIDLAGSFDVEKLVPIAKMVILCAADLNHKNVNGWLTKASKMSCLELKREVYGNERLHSFSTPVTERELKTINASIDYYREYVDETKSRGEVISTVLKEWSIKQKRANLKRVG